MAARDSRLDIAFLEIPSAFVTDNKLPSVTLDSAATDPAPGQTIIIAGYALGNPALHAAAVRMRNYEVHIDADMFQGVVLSPERNCKIVAHGVGYFGMSGGPALRDENIFSGTVNEVTNAKLAEVYLTSGPAIVRAYIDLYPERARRAGLKPPAAPSRPECAFKNEAEPKP